MEKQRAGTEAEDVGAGSRSNCVVLLFLLHENSAKSSNAYNPLFARSFIFHFPKR